MGLQVLGHREDGFHEIVTQLQSIGIGDIVDVQVMEDLDRKVEFVSLQAPKDWSVRMGLLLDKAMNEIGWSDQGVRVRIEKQIPIGAGLGGSGADYAGVLRCLGILSGKETVLQGISSSFGSDVPGMFVGGRNLCQGRGELVKSLPGGENLWFGVLLPPVCCDTEHMYREVEHHAESGGLDSASTMEGNDFEILARIMYPEIDQAFQALKGAGAGMVQLSGSGSAVFVVANEEKQAARCLEQACQQTGYSGILCDSKKRGYSILMNEWGVAKR